MDEYQNILFGLLVDPIELTIENIRRLTPHIESEIRIQELENKEKKVWNHSDEVRRFAVPGIFVDKAYHILYFYNNLIYYEVKSGDYPEKHYENPIFFEEAAIRFKFWNPRIPLEWNRGFEFCVISVCEFRKKIKILKNIFVLYSGLNPVRWTDNLLEAYEWKSGASRNIWVCRKCCKQVRTRNCVCYDQTLLRHGYNEGIQNYNITPLKNMIQG